MFCNAPDVSHERDAAFARFHSGAAGLQGMGRMPTEHNLGWEWGLYEKKERERESESFVRRSYRPRRV